MKVISYIDAFFAWVLQWPLKFLCGISGKSNFFWARAALVASTAAMTVNIYQHTPGNAITLALSVFFYMAVYTLAVALIWLMILDIERTSTDQAVMSQSEFSLRITRGPIMLVALLLIMIAPLSGSVTMLLSGSALFFATDRQPPAKTWQRRAAQKLLEHAKLVRPAQRLNPGGLGA